MSEIIKHMQGRGIPVRGNDIDTDRIIPARFMKCLTFSGLGIYAFNDERVDGNGRSKNHPFDNKKWTGNPILVGNANFGCGSSREHAPQALRDYGIRGIIAESFAEIFAGNCSSLGIPALTLEPSSIEELQSLIEEEPETDISIDIDKLTVSAGKNNWKANMPVAYQQSLLDGTWDSTAVLAQSMNLVKQVADNLPYVS